MHALAIKDHIQKTTMASTHSPQYLCVHNQVRQHNWDPNCSHCSPQTTCNVYKKKFELSYLDAYGSGRGPITCTGGPLSTRDVAVGNLRVCSEASLHVCLFLCATMSKSRAGSEVLPGVPQIHGFVGHSRACTPQSNKHQLPLECSINSPHLVGGISGS